MYHDRQHAGLVLARMLAGYADRDDVVVFGLPRGGVPVAFEVAKALRAPLDVLLVRKLGVPGHEELAMGAIASRGVRVLNHDVVEGLGLSDEIIDSVARREMRELERRSRLYRDDLPMPDIRDQVVIVIDDGLATGSTMRAAARALRQLGPRKVIVAVPVGAASTCDEFRGEVDEVVCGATPEPFYAVGLYYEDFSQTSDDEVRGLLAEARREHEQALHRAAQ